ncbi:hypothetical protein D3C72_1821930 [compost metagenome]
MLLGSNDFIPKFLKEVKNLGMSTAVILALELKLCHPFRGISFALKEIVPPELSI